MGCAAFSLIEVALALGVAAFSLVAILGLFPMAVQTAQEARRETRATMIAQSVFAEIKSGDLTKARIKKSAGDDDSDFIAPFDMTTGTGAKGIAYGEEGSPVGEITASFDQPAPGIAGAIHGARIQWEPAATGSRLIRVTVTVETPVAAKTADRRRYPFTTLIAP
jgi:type II secretory pathway pseudopilin PulG